MKRPNHERRIGFEIQPTMDFRVSIRKGNGSREVMITRRQVLVPLIGSAIGLGGWCQRIAREVSYKIIPIDAVRPFINKNRFLDVCNG
jgi:hypothetical protein